MTRRKQPLPLARALPLLFLLALWPASKPAGARDSPDLASIRRLLNDEDPRQRAAALRRLAGVADRASLRLLLEGLEDPHPYVRRASAGVLGVLDPGAWPRVARLLDRLGRPCARIEACRVAALWGQERGEALLLDLAGDREAAVRAAALRWLGTLPSEAAGAALLRGVGDRDGEVRAEALDALRTREGALPPAPALLQDSDSRVRLSALESSVALGAPSGRGERAVSALLHGLDDAVWSIRLRAAELARVTPDRRLLAPLIRRLEDERRRVRDTAHAALVGLTGIPFDPDPATWTTWLEGDGQTFDPGGRVPPPRAHRLGRDQTVARARFLDLPIPSRYVAFVLDASGSMRQVDGGGRSRWARVRQALAEALEALGPAQVNVHLFGTEVVSAFAHAERLTPARRRALLTWLDEHEPGGRTALYDGVARALSDEAVDTVILLSDGAPSAGLFFTRTDLLAEVARKNRWRRARIDVLDVGGDSIARRWRGVLRQVAKDSGGTYRRL